MDKLTVKILIFGMLIPVYVFLVAHIWGLIDSQLVGSVLATIWCTGGVIILIRLAKDL